MQKVPNRTLRRPAEWDRRSDRAAVLVRPPGHAASGSFLAEADRLEEPAQRVAAQEQDAHLCRARGYAESFCFSGRKWLTGRSFLA